MTYVSQNMSLTDGGGTLKLPPPRLCDPTRRLTFKIPWQQRASDANSACVAGRLDFLCWHNYEHKPSKGEMQWWASDGPKTRLFSLSAVQAPANFQPKIQTQNAVSEDVGQLWTQCCVTARQMEEEAHPQFVSKFVVLSRGTVAGWRMRKKKDAWATLCLSGGEEQKKAAIKVSTVKPLGNIPTLGRNFHVRVQVARQRMYPLEQTRLHRYLVPGVLIVVLRCECESVFLPFNDFVEIEEPRISVLGRQT